MIDTMTAGVLQSIPKFVPTKRRVQLADAMLSKINAAAQQPVVSGRPVAAASPRAASTIPVNPFSAGVAQTTKQSVISELMTLLADPAATAQLPGSPISGNLLTAVGLGVRQGRPELIRQVLAAVGGTGLTSEFNLLANSIQETRGSSGRFASPEAADLGAALLTAAKLELRAFGGATQAKVGSYSTPLLSTGLTSTKSTTAQLGLGGVMQIGGLWDDIVSAIEDVWDSITDWFADTFGPVGSWFQEQFGHLWSNIGAFLEEVGSWFGASSGWFDDFGAWFGGLADGLRKKFVGFCAKIAEAAEECWGAVQGFIEVLEEAIDYIVGCVSDIKQCIMDILNYLLQYLLEQLLKLIKIFLQNALRALVWIFGELGKAIGGKLSQFGQEVRNWIRGEFAEPLDEVALWVWDAAWGSFEGSLVCLCEKACIQPLAGGLKDADNVWVKLIGNVLWYLHPILQGDPHHNDVKNFPWENLQPYSFCRWVYQGGQGMLPEVKLEESAQELVDFVVDEFGGAYALSQPDAGPSYRKYMVDRVARDFFKDLGASSEAIDGSGFTKGPTTLFTQQSRSARWYLHHPKDAAEVLGNPVASLNPTPAWVGLRARELADNILNNYCQRPSSWFDWLENQYYIHEIPGKRPYPSCATPTGEAVGGQCWYPYDWFRILNSAPIRNAMKEQCFNLNAVRKYVGLLATAMWNWGGLSEDNKQAFRGGGTYANYEPDLLAGFSMDIPCDASLEQWCIPPWGGTPSPFYMGWPTWQGKAGNGFIKHFPSNCNKTAYFSYVMDWMEANSRPVSPEEVNPTEAQKLGAVAAEYNAGSFVGGQLVRPPRADRGDANIALKLASGRLLWESIQQRRQGFSTATFTPQKQATATLIPQQQSLGALPAQSSSVLMPQKIGPATQPPEVYLPAEDKPRFTLVAQDGGNEMSLVGLPVGYDIAHQRYQEIWKAMTPEQRREWLQDYPFANANIHYYNNPYVYNPEGPPEPPDIQGFPGQNKGVTADQVGYSAGQWIVPSTQSMYIDGGDQYTTAVQETYVAPQVVDYGVLIPSRTRTDSASDLEQLLLDPNFQWGSFPMTRKRFWAGEMLAFFEGTPWGSLDDPMLTELALDAVGDGTGTTSATPAAVFVPNGEDTPAAPAESAQDYFHAAPSMASDLLGKPDIFLEDQPEMGFPTEETEPEGAEAAPPEKSGRSALPWVLGGAGLAGLAAFLILGTSGSET